VSIRSLSLRFVARIGRCGRRQRGPCSRVLARLCGDAVPEVEYLAMGPAKAALIRAIEDQPDDSSYEEILRSWRK
jgi:hypothetical protein